MSKTKKTSKQIKKPRDLSILAAFKGEINLKTQVQQDKTKYSKGDRKSQNQNLKKEEY